VEMLVDARADVRAKDNDGDDPIHEAARRGQKDVVEYLASQGVESSQALELLKTGVTPLHQAAAAGNIGQIKALLSQGANVNAKDRADARPLYYAAEKGHEDAEELLLAHGATLDTKNTRHNETPRQAATRAGHNAIAEFLATREADSPQPVK